MMRDLMLQDERLEAQMRQLAMNLSEFLPLDEMAQRYPFQGDQEMNLQEAMRLMEEMQQMDELERELRGIRNLEDLDRVAPEKVEQLLGPEAREDRQYQDDPSHGPGGTCFGLQGRVPLSVNGVELSPGLRSLAPGQRSFW